MITASCHNSKKSSANKNQMDLSELKDQQLSLKGTQWQIQSLYGENIDTSEATSKDFVMQFDPKMNTFKAKAGCNSIGGEYQQTDTHLVFMKVYSSEKMCKKMTYENHIKEIINMKLEYRSSSNLLIFLNDNNIVAKFNRIKQ